MAKEPSPQAQMEKELLIKIRKMPSDWAALSEEIDVPVDLGVAISTGRPELLTLAARAMTKEEVVQLLNAMRVLMETNQLLKEHTELVAIKAKNFSYAVNAAVNQARRLSEFACYRSEEGVGEEDDG